MISQQDYTIPPSEKTKDPNWPYNKKITSFNPGVWIAYSNTGTLFESDLILVIFDTEVEALRFAVKDTTRIIKVVFVPFGKPIADYLV